MKVKPKTYVQSKKEKDIKPASSSPLFSKKKVPPT